MISRRAFSTHLIGSLGLLTCAQSHAQKPAGRNHSSDLLIGGGRYFDLDAGTEKFVLSLVEPETLEPQLIPVDFFPHGLAAKPGRANELLVMEKKGPGCALVDIHAKEIRANLSASTDCWFYGHGAYSKDGSNLYVVETNLRTERGLLSIRDADTGRILGEMDTYGANPHDCQLLANENFLAITNAGLGKNSTDADAAPCVTYVDVNSGKLLEKIPLTNTEINAGHLLVTKNFGLAVVSAPREGLAPSEPGGISLRPAGLEMKSLSSPMEITHQLRGETLSLAYHAGTDILATTTPDANLVTFWKMEDRSFISAVKLLAPRGLCLSSDQNYFLVSAGELPALYSIDAQDLSKVTSVNQNTYISGSHLYNGAQFI